MENVGMLGITVKGFDVVKPGFNSMVSSTNPNEASFMLSMINQGGDVVLKESGIRVTKNERQCKVDSIGTFGLSSMPSGKDEVVLQRNIPAWFMMHVSGSGCGGISGDEYTYRITMKLDQEGRIIENSGTLTGKYVGEKTLDQHVDRPPAGNILLSPTTTLTNDKCGDRRIDEGEECDSGQLNGPSFCSSRCKLIWFSELPVMCQLMSGIAEENYKCRVWFGSRTGSCTITKGASKCTSNLTLPQNGNEGHYKFHLKGELEGHRMVVNAYNGAYYFVNFGRNTINSDAAISQKVVECQAKATTSEVDSCLLTAGEEMLDSGLCGYATAQDFRDGCFYEVGIGLRNITICDRITNSDWKKQCYETVI